MAPERPPAPEQAPQESASRAGPAQTRPRGMLPVLFSIVIVDLISFGIVVPILPYWADEFGANGLVLGALLTSHAGMQFVMAPLWGRLSDRIGRRPVMLVTIFGTAASLVLLGLAESLTWLFVARLLSGTFAANISVATAYVADVTDESERTDYMGKIGASFAIGFTVGPLIGGALSPFGHGVPMLVAGGLAALNGIVALFSLQEPVRHERSDEVGPGRLAVLRNPFVARLCAVNLLFSLAVTQLESMFAFYLLHRFGYGPLPFVLILVGMAVVMGGIQGGGMKKLGERFGERPLLSSGLGMLGIAFALLPWPGSIGWLLAVLFLAAIGRGISQPPMMSLVSVAADPQHRGVVMGTFQSAASIARVVGPLVAGALYDHDPGGPFLLAAALALAACFGSLALRTAVPEDRATPTHAPSIR